MKTSDCRRVWDARTNNSTSLYVNVVDFRAEGDTLRMLQFDLADGARSMRLWLGRAQGEYLQAVLSEWLGSDAKP